MSSNVKGIVMQASTIPLLGQATLKGQNTYTLGTNLVSWDAGNNYLLSQIAPTFGRTVECGGAEQLRFMCGDDTISVFDFGLLFSCFIAMSAARAELGTSVQVLSEDTSVPGTSIVWFGTSGVLYSKQSNYIIPLRSADVQRACRYENVTVDNFIVKESYALRREQTFLALESRAKELLIKVPIPLLVQRVYANLFDASSDNDVVKDNPDTPWDESSPLGNIIMNSINTTDAESTIRRYQSVAVLDSVVVRDDLIFTPTKRYSSTEKLFGSLCYTNRNTVALAINFRNNLFVYRDWFTDEEDKEQALRVDANPKFSDFYNVMDECRAIEQFAKSVTVKPLTAAQFDLAVFEKIKAAFYDVKLPRVQLSSSLGKIVIPEPVLLQSLGMQSGESVYCIVPVGAIGNNIICKNEDGVLVATQVQQDDDGVWQPWGFDTAYYDITNFVASCSLRG